MSPAVAVRVWPTCGTPSIPGAPVAGELSLSTMVPVKIKTRLGLLLDQFMTTVSSDSSRLSSMTAMSNVADFSPAASVIVAKVLPLRKSA